MATPLRILYLEDEPTAVELTQALLEAEGFACVIVRVETGAEFAVALMQDGWDLIFSDQTLLAFDGLQALALARTHRPEVPFIFISGTLGEEVAVESLKNGATDYVLKQQLLRLVPVTRRALREAAEHRERQVAQAGLAVSEADLRALLAAMTDVVVVLDRAGRYLQIAPTNPVLLVKPPADLLGRTVQEVLPPAEAAHILQQIHRTLETQQPLPLEYSVPLGGATVWFDGILSPLGTDQVFWVAHDITERKQAEAAVRENEARFRLLFTSNPLPMWVYDRATLQFLEVNEAAVAHYGYSRAEFLHMHIVDIRAPEDAARLPDDLTQARPAWQQSGEWQHRRKNGQVMAVEITSHPLTYAQREACLVVVNDITERKRAEVAQRASQEQVRLLLDSTAEGIYGLDLDGTCTFSNAACARLLGYRDPKQLIGQNMHALSHHTKVDGTPYPPEACRILPALRRGAGTHVDTEVFWRADGTSFPAEYWAYPIRHQDQVVGVVVTFLDISERHRAEDQIRQHVRRLAALRNIDQSINATLDLRLTLKVLLDQVLDQLGVDAAAVLLLDPYTQVLEFAAGRGFRTRDLDRMRLRADDDPAGRALRERRLVGIPDLAANENPFIRASLLARDHFVAYYGVPLIAKGRNQGVLEVFHRTRLEPDPEWLDFFEALAGQAGIAIDNAHLFDDLQRSNTELIQAYDTTIEGWSHALDLRDKETEGHSQRVMEMTVRLARGMGIGNPDLMHIRRGALLHDIGKMGVPDTILLKTGPLTDAEWVLMRQHPVYAYELLAPISYLRQALDIPYAHHEKWDGTGYPRGLKGTQIPLAARLFAVADVWDALRSDRPYRAAWTEEKTRVHLREQAGIQFDPYIVAVFLDMV